MELIDFCHKDLADISSDSVSSDQYKLENLIATSDTDKANGFRPESFIRPPISVIVTFKNPVKLSHIDLTSPEAGRVDLKIKAFNSDFVDAGRANLTCERLTFKNYRFLDNSSKSLDQRPTFERRISLPHDQRSILYNCQALKLTIVFTRSPVGIVSLKSLRIFGLPRHRSDWTIWKEILKRKREDSRGSGPSCIGFFGSRLEEEKKEAPTSKEEVPDKESVPEEFLDKLTFELMQIPMVLPSGQVIDKKNLDKHNENEAKYGRPPSDPFTGKPYSRTSKPILDHVLKSRIDQFSAKRHGVDYSSIKRRNLDNIGYRAKRSKSERCWACKGIEPKLFLPCDHGICRDCALKTDLTLKCGDCEEPFTKSQLERRHVHL